MFQQISVEYKSSYGNHRYYPQCDISKTIIKLMKAKSFTADDINLLRNVFTVDVDYSTQDKE